MRKLSVAVILAALCALPAWGGVSLGESWFKVQQALNKRDARSLRAHVTDLEARARELNIKHLTPYARTLAVWADHDSGEAGDLAATLARELDPSDASGWFVSARKRWKKGVYASAATAYARGWLGVVETYLTRRDVIVSLTPFLLLSLGLALLVATILNTLRFLPEMFHDSLELGRLLFRRADAAVFAVVVLALPLFSGLGPVWLIGYLFALSWAYLDPRKRVLAGVAWLLLVLLVPGLEAWQRYELRQSTLLARVGSSLERRSLDPSTVQEFADLEGKMDKYAEYHLVLGALFRLHDDGLSARVQFQKAAFGNPKDPRPQVFLGNLSLSEGNLPEAIQNFSLAVKKDPQYALAYLDLSLAYDQSYRFQEADQMRAKARALAGKNSLRLTSNGTNAAPIDPEIGMPEIDRLLKRVPGDVRLASGLSPADRRVVGWFFRPFSLAFFATGALGLLIVTLRNRWMWTARACSRCGKVFCPRCKTESESEAYCSQCISVFLKRDRVAIEQQSAKLDQIRRWERRSMWVRRLVALILPGGGMVVQGRWGEGMVSGFLVLTSAGLTFLWLPMIVTEFEPMASVLPLQIALGGFFLVTWFWTIRVSWGGK